MDGPSDAGSPAPLVRTVELPGDWSWSADWDNAVSPAASTPSVAGGVAACGDEHASGAGADATAVLVGADEGASNSLASPVGCRRDSTRNGDGATGVLWTATTGWVATVGRNAGVCAGGALPLEVAPGSPDARRSMGGTEDTTPPGK